jgi:hypothetical protein
MALLKDAKKVYTGSTLATKVYMGNALAWPLAFVPSQLSGLKIWLDASHLAGADGSAVSPWPNLAAGGVSGTIVGTPAPQISTAKLNGNKVVRFKANEGRVRMPGNGVIHAHTLVYVSRMIGPTPGRVVCAAYPEPNFLIGWWNGKMNVAYSTSGAFFSPTGSDGLAWDAQGIPSPWIMYSSDADAAPSFIPRMFRSGTLLATSVNTGTAGINDGFNDTFDISGYAPTTSEETCDCEIAEVCLYDHRLTDPERQQVENYLKQKWGLP